MKAVVDSLNSEQSDSEFAAKVEKQNDSRIRQFGGKNYSCTRCKKCFSSLWELNRHTEKCRTESAKYLMLRSKDHYPCDCCGKKFDSLREFKRHAFLWHSLSDIWRHYNRTIEGLLGKRDFHECRQPILNTIRNGKFQEFITNLLRKKIPFDPDVIDRRLPIV